MRWLRRNRLDVAAAVVFLSFMALFVADYLWMVNG